MSNYPLGLALSGVLASQIRSFSASSPSTTEISADDFVALVLSGELPGTSRLFRFSVLDHFVENA